MKRCRGIDDERQLCSGPGKLTQALDITIRHHEMNLCANERFCFRKPTDSVEVVADRRIGIRVSADLPWRFTFRDNQHVSVRSQLNGRLEG
jgi:DNA-3-methyladenine glycosylase